MGMFSQDDREWASEECARENAIVSNLNSLSELASKSNEEVKNTLAKHIWGQIADNGGFSLTPFWSYSSDILVSHYSDITLKVIKSVMTDEEKRCLDLYVWWLKNSGRKTPVVRLCVIVLDYGYSKRNAYYGESKEDYWAPDKVLFAKIENDKRKFLEKVKSQSLESLIAELKEEIRNAW